MTYGFLARMMGPWEVQGKGVREGEIQKKKKTDTFQEQITFNQARKGSSQISELLH